LFGQRFRSGPSASGLDWAGCALLTGSDAVYNDVTEAFELAKQLVDGRDVELWQLDRQIGTVKAHVTG
jgi:hypothetical protein